MGYENFSELNGKGSAVAFGPESHCLGRQRDPYTSGHSERVAEYRERVATALQLSDEQRHFLSLSAWLVFGGDEHIFDATSCDSIEKTLNGNSTRGRPNSGILIFGSSAYSAPGQLTRAPFYFFPSHSRRWGP